MSDSTEVMTSDFSVAATSLVDLSHLQETVVWLVNQLHRHQDEISILQNRRDVDIPTIKAQLYKQRVWMVEKKYQYRVEKCLAYGFHVFAKTREDARSERSKWRAANARAYKTAATKVMRAWEAFWQEEKVYRHHVKFSLRNIRRNRLGAMFGIWQHDWMIEKRDRAIIAARDAREARMHKINGLTGFFNQWARKQRHRAMIKRMTIRRNDFTKGRIVTAWKFLIDFQNALAHKLHFLTTKRARLFKIDAMYTWKAVVEEARRHRGVVARNYRYNRNRRLQQAMEDWSASARLQHKLRLLEICEQANEDPLELAEAMEHVVDGIVMRQNVRVFELQVAHALRGRIADLKLQASVTMLEAYLAKKVDKPTAEMIQRRGLRSWEAISQAQGTQKTEHKTAASPKTTSKTAAEATKAEPSAEASAEPTADEPNAALPQSSHRMLLEQQYRDQAARHIAHHVPIGSEAYMRNAALAHAVPPPHVADMHSEANARANAFLGGHADHIARQRQLDEMNAAAAHHDAAQHHAHMQHMHMQEQAMRDGGLLGGHAAAAAPGAPPASPPKTEESALTRAREQVNNLRNELQSESHRGSQ